MESRAVDGIDIVGTGITEEKKKKKLIERMAENLHHMVIHLLWEFLVSLENKLKIVTLCLNIVLFLLFLLQLCISNSNQARIL